MLSRVWFYLRSVDRRPFPFGPGLSHQEVHCIRPDERSGVHVFICFAASIFILSPCVDAVPNYANVNRRRLLSDVDYYRQTSLR